MSYKLEMNASQASREGGDTLSIDLTITNEGGSLIIRESEGTSISVDVRDLALLESLINSARSAYSAVASTQNVCVYNDF